MAGDKTDTASVLDVIKALARPLKTDRVLPPIPGTPPEAFEALYARRPDPWGVLTSPLAHERWTLDPIVAQYCPPEERVFHSFFGLKHHGFTIARLTDPGAHGSP